MLTCSWPERPPVSVLLRQQLVTNWHRGCMEVHVWWFWGRGSATNVQNESEIRVSDGSSQPTQVGWNRFQNKINQTESHLAGCPNLLFLLIFIRFTTHTKTRHKYRQDVPFFNGRQQFLLSQCVRKNTKIHGSVVARMPTICSSHMVFHHHGSSPSERIKGRG